MSTQNLLLKMHRLGSLKLEKGMSLLMLIAVYSGMKICINPPVFLYMSVPYSRTSAFPKTGTLVKTLVAIPTTSGTGSEVSPFTVITSDEGQKYPIASYKLTPEVAICDSTLCDSLPKSLIRNAGLDSIVHGVESYVSVAQNDFTKTQSLEALKLLFDYLPESYISGNPIARDACHRGSTIAGIAFSNAFLGITHSLAHKVGALFHLPHGMTCAILLPHVIEYNASESPTKMGIYPSYHNPQSASRYAAIAKHIGASSHDTEGLIKSIHSVMLQLETPLTFQGAGVNESDFMGSLDELSRDAFDDQCTAANPRYPLVSELKEILMKSYYGAEPQQERQNEKVVLNPTESTEPVSAQ